MRRATPLTCLFFFLLAVQVGFGEEPEIRVEIGADRAYVGRPLSYRVIVRQLETTSAPKFEPSSDFELRLLNDVANAPDFPTTQNEPRESAERVYRYRLVPRKAGRITIPAPRVSYHGTVLLGSEKVIEVQPMDPQGIAFLKISTDRAVVYPMQQFTVTLTVMVQELPGIYADRDPMDILADMKLPPPRLRVPWIADAQIPEGLSPCIPWEDWLEPLRNRQESGFRINNVGERSVQTLFGKRVVTFRPEPHKVVRPDKNGIERRYWQFDFSRQFLAEKVGTYEFGPVTLDGELASSLDDQKQLVTEEIYGNAQPVRVTVRPIPEEGRPDAYVGAIGQFQVDGQLTPLHAKVGDPMTLQIRLHGSGRLAGARPPSLNAIPAIARQFRVYEATRKSSPGEVQFTYRLRPLQSGTDVFPSVPVAYFDIAKEQYVVLRTEPIRIRVLPATRLSSDQIVVSPSGRKQDAEQSIAQRAGVYGNVTDPSAVGDETVNPASWIFTMAAFGALYVAAIAIVFRMRRRAVAAVPLRRRAAFGRARRGLRQAQNALSEGHNSDAAELAETSVVGLVADALGLPQTALTRGDIRDRLLEHGIEGDLVDDTVQMLEACDMARFGGSEERFAELAGTWDDTITRLIRSLKKEG